MHRDFNSSTFALSGMESEDVDPMASIANLADAMLVFACGLMLALVINWNINIAPDMTQVNQTGEVQKAENAEEVTSSQEEGGKGYEEVGTAYRDPETGQLYVAVQE